MTGVQRIFCVILVLMFQQSAMALDPSGSVKAVTVLKTENSWDGTPIRYPEGKAEITGMLIEIAPNTETGWHVHEVPSFGMVLEGELEIQRKDGQIKKLKAGDGFAEVVNTLHNGRNPGPIPVKLIVFYAGALGKTLTVKENAQ